MVSSSVVLTTLLILIGRAVDVTLGTLRIVAVIRGRKLHAFVLGIAEIGIWLLILSRVVTDLSQYPSYGVAYALGFGLGNIFGIWVESRFDPGYTVFRIFTRKDDEMARRFRESGYEVTTFQGEGLKGPIALLFIQVDIRQIPDVRTLAEEIDDECFYVMDDAMLSSSARTRRQRKGK